MESRASYFLVGLFVLTIIAGTLAAFLWVVRFQLRDDRTFYYVYFTGAVTGLQEGSPVRLRGVPVGTVTDVSIDDKNVELIQVTLGIRAGTPVKTDTRASIQPQGITGLFFIQLSGGTNDAPDLLPAAGKRRAVIEPEASQIEKILMGAPELLVQLADLSQRASLLLGDQNLASVRQALSDVAKVTSAVASHTNDIDQLLTNTSETLVALRRTSTAISGMATDLSKLTNELNRSQGRLTANADGAITDLRTTLKRFDQVGTELQRLVADTRGPVKDFSTTGLFELTQLLIDARTLLQRWSRVTVQFERDPARFLFGDQNKGVEAR
jgi:phospholipid/cholesterol/gamma-HCH transport system substrate-binding protein